MASLPYPRTHSDNLPQNSRNTQNLLLRYSPTEYAEYTEPSAEKSLPQISQIYTETFSKKVLCVPRILWEFLYTNLKAIEVLS